MFRDNWDLLPDLRAVFRYFRNAFPDLQGLKKQRLVTYHGKLEVYGELFRKLIFTIKYTLFNNFIVGNVLVMKVYQYFTLFLALRHFKVDPLLKLDETAGWIYVNSRKDFVQSSLKSHSLCVTLYISAEDDLNFLDAVSTANWFPDKISFCWAKELYIPCVGSNIEHKGTKLHGLRYLIFYKFLASAKFLF